MVDVLMDLVVCEVCCFMYFGCVMIYCIDCDGFLQVFVEVCDEVYDMLVGMYLLGVGMMFELCNLYSYNFLCFVVDVVDILVGLVLLLYLFIGCVIDLMYVVLCVVLEVQCEIMCCMGVKVLFMLVFMV